MAGFKEVAERDANAVVDLPTKAKTTEETSAAFSLIMLALKSLSQRTLIAISNLFTLLTVGSAFWLWMTMAGDPTVRQLVALGMYAAFVLAVNWIVKKV